MLYRTLIYPYLEYCNLAWGAAKPTILNQLLLVQKKAVRLCTGSSYRSSSSPLFAQLQLLKVTDICTLNAAIYMYKLRFNLLPISCLDYVVDLNLYRLHETRKRSAFKLLKFRTNIREQSLPVRGPKLLNSLNSHVLAYFVQ